MLAGSILSRWTSGRVPASTKRPKCEAAKAARFSEEGRSIQFSLKKKRVANDANYMAEGGEDPLADLRQDGCRLDVIVSFADDDLVGICADVAH